MPDQGLQTLTSSFRPYVNCHRSSKGLSMAEPNRTKIEHRLTPLEIATLSFTLGVIDDRDVSPTQLAEEVTVRARKNTKMGSNVTLDRSEILKTKTPCSRKIHDNIGGSMQNGTVDFGVLAFVTDGYISDLEFFVYGHGFGVDWPEEQNEFSLFINKDELT